MLDFAKRVAKMLVSGSPSLAAKDGHGRAAGEPRQRFSSRVVQFFEKRCNSLADFCLCGYFLVDFARGVAKMLVSGLPSLAAKDGHGRAAGEPRQRYSSRVVHFFEKYASKVS